MANSALDTISELVRSFQIGSRQLFERAFHHHLTIATEAARGNHYVDDCVDLVHEALDRLFADDSEADAARAHLLGAIEALRDELCLSSANEPAYVRATAS
ncbi:hypothetical protein [Peteryoungia ipomoeae]|uniref:Uncharacterized protein n=1 Tax=Peteryoungia ipomoeae TaxID=1210932 RepID=A0A4S8P7D1_9HYPH|nr:hypothetical protein [Peteryoungia ipomoeae]THV25355.1 hypothetical protein FAA97_03925 [Peteryoungia ipomoeae]